MWKDDIFKKILKQYFSSYCEIRKINQENNKKNLWKHYMYVKHFKNLEKKNKKLKLIIK